MVRNYVRKTERAMWEEGSMKSAIYAVKNKEMSIGKAAAAYNVPKESLRRRIKGVLKLLSVEDLHKNKLGSYRKVLSETEEFELVKYIKDMDNAFYGLTINDLRHVVYDYVDRKKINHPFNTYKKLAGYDFVEGFLKRCPTLSLRKPEDVALNRVFGLNKTSVDQYFNNLQTILDKHNFQPHRIYNCDESGLTCVHKPQKVLAQKGKRVVASVTSGERGVTTTVICCYSAGGNYIPPMMIFKRKRMKPELLDRTPVGTIGGCSDSGWIETNLFLTWIKHFCKYSNASKNNQVLLILVGHKTHTKTLS